jgi:tetratricopeptide (TPR) repeat protein
MRFGLYMFGAITLIVLAYLGWFYVPHLGLDQDKTEVFRFASEGEWDEARRLIEVMDERYPDDIRVPLLRGWLEEGVGNLDGSTRAYERALELCKSDAEHLELLVTLADIQRRRGEAAVAEARLEEATNRYGESAKTRQLRAILLMSKCYWDAALGEVDKLAEENPVDPHASRLRRRIRKLREANEASGSNESVPIIRLPDK